MRIPKLFKMTTKVEIRGADLCYFDLSFPDYVFILPLEAVTSVRQVINWLKYDTSLYALARRSGNNKLPGEHILLNHPESCNNLEFVYKNSGNRSQTVCIPTSFFSVDMLNELISKSKNADIDKSVLQLARKEKSYIQARYEIWMVIFSVFCLVCAVVIFLNILG